MLETLDYTIRIGSIGLYIGLYPSCVGFLCSSEVYTVYRSIGLYIGLYPSCVGFLCSSEVYTVYRI